MNYKEEPILIYLGDNRFGKQCAQKICLDYSKRIVRMSLILRPEQQKVTSRKGTTTTPKHQRVVVHVSFDDPILQWEGANLCGCD